MTDPMQISDVRAAFRNQAHFCRANDAPLTARIVEGILAQIDRPAEFARVIREWRGTPVADALPLRAAAALHALHLSGAEPALAPLYEGEPGDAATLIGEAIDRHDAAMLLWLDGPPQTNEAGRSSSYAAALLWLAAQGWGSRVEALEIGSSAGINLMMGRYAYDLGGVRVGSHNPVITLTPEWRGAPPPPGKLDFASLRGCDVAPVDLTDPAALLRLKAYVWPEHRQRFARLDAAARAARARRPELVQADAAEFVADALARPQTAGTGRVLMHSIVWQYLGAARQAAITDAMLAAGARADATHPLAWIALETNGATSQHELVVRSWPGDGQPRLLARAHAHGAWIEWLA